MTSLEIRRAFLEFFAERGHRVVASSPLVLPNDPTLLGASFYQQVVQTTQYCSKGGCGPPTIRLTRGGHGVIGY